MYAWISQVQKKRKITDVIYFLLFLNWKKIKPNLRWKDEIKMIPENEDDHNLNLFSSNQQ
jgi:hypothetical protein